MTMNSVYTVSPASLHQLRGHPQDRPLHTDLRHGYNHKGPVTPVESHLLSPYSSHIQSNSTSPAGNFNTPADSISSLDVYSTSEFDSDFPDDSFFGVDFNNVETGTAQFLEGPSGTQQSVNQYTQGQANGIEGSGYPISPHQTPSVPATSAFSNSKPTSVDLQEPVVPQPFATQPRPSAKSVDSNQSAPQLTPDTNAGSFSSEDCLAPATLAMASQSPRVTVSMWNRDEEGPIQGIERSFTTGSENTRTVRTSHSIAGDLAYEPPHESLPTVSRDALGNWVPNSITGQRGLAPGNRPSEEVPSPNQQAARRLRQEKNKEVLEWVSQSINSSNDNHPGGAGDSSSSITNSQRGQDDNIPAGEIPLGDTTENKHIAGQAYLNMDGPGGPITRTDFDIMRQLQTWGNAPTIHAIQSGQQYQPPTSQAAIDKFNRQCQDNESIVSRAATWGTRRRSLPSLVDMDGVVSGNFLKKLSISSHSRRPSFIKKIPSLVRRPSASQLLKRKGSNASEVPPEDLEDSDRRELKDTLAPPSRTSSWGIGGISKKPTPSLNTALVGMATGAAAIGATHARSGSISATSITSPKSQFGSLSVPPVKLRRQRSKTENSVGLTHPNLVEMLKKQGGPPVASLARSQPAAEPDDDDDDDDDEGFDEAEMKSDSSKPEIIEPTFAGFRAEILRLNPGLPAENGWLADRIAHQQTGRYKQLLKAKVQHLRQVNQGKCPCGTMCIALGGSAIPLDSKFGDRSVDPLSARPDSSDGDSTPLEGGINAESFPQGIPVPPTASLPAEFECQLCFTSKKFQKPSDWTKHVHEDIQPFTCTWERCREPKVFKRKADWVRHENEGHRHLEWWTCDVEDCRHVCYRRDNFLQHLVREHKFTEPKVKTKAAIKKAGGGDPTWHRVEQCHRETDTKPSDEPCRFCRKTFPTWKKLTVHLAKHMECISLPVLQLAAAKALDADTIISPVHDPPPRSFGLPASTMKQEPQTFSTQGSHTASNQNSNPMEYGSQNTPIYNLSQMQLQNSYYGQPQTVQPYPEMPSNQAPGMMMASNFNPQPQYQALPVTTGSSFDPSANAYMNLPTQELEPFPAFNPLGIQESTGTLGYDNLANSGIQPVEHYGSHPGSVSPYHHSPHQGHGGTFYNP
ncbi:hypothetical protein F4779DRAFT_1995 [Xylariaceae sp. FL0662B]|nr:hypothetical protein F4779DRAFT_1995 [Xylariaceae sp. FL0662B]